MKLLIPIFNDVLLWCLPYYKWNV